MKTQLLIVALLLTAGCIRDETTTTTTLPPIIINAPPVILETTTSTTILEPIATTSSNNIQMILFNETTTTTQTGPKCCYPTECPGSKLNPSICQCYYNIICPTTTTTLKKRTLTPVMPVRMNISANWTSCNKDRDCQLLPDCCGWDYGLKYAINEWSIGSFELYKTNFCSSKDHRVGCGWDTPKATIAKCQNDTCIISYGGFIPDELQDNNFTYFFNWMKRLDNINYTVIDNGTYEPPEEYDPYGLYTPDNGSMRGDMQ
jgi:hypothetical protein